MQRTRKLAGLLCKTYLWRRFVRASDARRYMASEEQRRWRAKAIQESIGQILLSDWDPIGVSDIPEAQGEYDSYVGEVYRLLASQCSADDIIDHLVKIESQTMGLQPVAREKLRLVARRLIALNVAL